LTFIFSTFLSTQIQIIHRYGWSEGHQHQKLLVTPKSPSYQPTGIALVILTVPELVYLAKLPIQQTLSSPD